VRGLLAQGEQKVVHGGGQLRYRPRCPPDRLFEQPYFGHRVQIVLGERYAGTHVEHMPHRRTGIAGVGQRRHIAGQLRVNVQRSVADQRADHGGDQRLAHRHQQMGRLRDHAAVIVLVEHLPVPGNDPAVGRGGGHHTADGGPLAVRPVEHRNVGEFGRPRRQLGDWPGAPRNRRSRKEIGDVLERPVQMCGGLPVFQRHIRRNASGIAAEHVVAS
jgi:hypothetical protein